MSNLSPKFYKKLVEMCSRLKVSPADMLLVMYLESRLDPNVKGHAAGLTQFIPDTLKDYFSGTPDQFRRLKAEEQLPYIERYFADTAKGKDLDPVQFYIANLLPAKLNDPKVINKQENAILARDNDFRTYTSKTDLTYDKAYEANKGLDVNQDGVLTYKDIKEHLNKLSQEEGYKQALRDLEESTGYKEENIIEKFVSKLIEEMSKIMSSISSSLSFAATSSHDNFLIKISSPCLENNLEFARILSTACEDLIFAKCTTYADADDVEINCKTSFSSNQAIPAIKEFSSQLLNQFSQQTKIKDLNVSILANKTPSYQPLDIKVAELNYRKFMLKQIGKRNG